MATLNTVRTLVAGRGHIFTATVDATPFDLEAFARGRMCAVASKLRNPRFIGNPIHMHAYAGGRRWVAGILQLEKDDAPSADEERRVVFPREHKHLYHITVKYTGCGVDASRTQIERHIPWRPQRQTTCTQRSAENLWHAVP